MHIEQTKNDIWVYRRRIESELEEAYKEFTGNSQPFFKRSLSTRDKKEAEQVAVSAEMEYHSLMQTLRHRAHLSADELRKAHLSLRVGGLLRNAKAKLDLELVRSLIKNIDAELVQYKKEIKAAKNLNEWVDVKYGKQHNKQMPLKDYYQHLQNASRILHVYERMFLEPKLDISKELKATRRLMQEGQFGLGDIFLDKLHNHRLSTPENLAKEAMRNGKAPKLSEAIESWKKLNRPSEGS